MPPPYIWESELREKRKENVTHTFIFLRVFTLSLTVEAGRC